MTKKNIIYFFIVIALIIGVWKFREIKKENRRAKIAELPLRERGLALLEEEGCTSCHKPGNPWRAPIIQKIFGTTRNLTNGSTVVADRDYILRSILNPQAEIVFGFQGTMPAYKDRFSDVEIDAFVEAMK